MISEDIIKPDKPPPLHGCVERSTVNVPRCHRAITLNRWVLGCKATLEFSSRNADWHANCDSQLGDKNTAQHCRVLARCVQTIGDVEVLKWPNVEVHYIHTETHILSHRANHLGIT